MLKKVPFYLFSCFSFSGVVTLIITALTTSVSGLVASGCLMVSGVLGMERMRTMETMDSFETSADELEKQVKGIREENEVLVKQNKELKGIVGLLDGTEKNLAETEKKLFHNYSLLCNETKKHAQNNLIHFFSSVDSDKNGVLDADEIELLRDFSVRVYDVDLTKLDVNHDGKISIKEFVDFLKKI